MSWDIDNKIMEPHPNPTWVCYGADLGKGAGSVGRGMEILYSYAYFSLIFLRAYNVLYSNFNSKLLN